MILEGKVAPGFERVQRLYERNMRNLAERNTQLCVYVEDECVVDLWGSAIDDSSFNGDSLVNVFSSSKTLESILLARLFDKGLIDYNEPIATYWPEFCQQGGQPSSTTIADMMRHEAGLAAFDASIPLASLQADAIKQNAIGKIIEQQRVYCQRSVSARRTPGSNDGGILATGDHWAAGGGCLSWTS